MKTSHQIEKIRTLLEINTSELAELIGTSPELLMQWEKEKTTPSEKEQTIINGFYNNAINGNTDTDDNISGLNSVLFASRGAAKNLLDANQLELFSQPYNVRLSDNLKPSILSLIKNGIFFGDGENVLEEILEQHNKPTPTPDQPADLEISAGKNTYTYDAHTYHTKVPPQGIYEFLRKYIPENGLVLDPFAGSGMTGVASRIYGSDIILNELSPAACFISHNFTEKISAANLGITVRLLLNSLESIRNTLYSTKCRECGKKTEILYTVWSYNVICNYCGHEFLLWDHCRSYGNSVREHKILSEFPCPSCGKLLHKRLLKRTTAEPVMLGYKCCSKHQTEHPLSTEDIENINLIDKGDFLVNDYYPKNKLQEGVNLNQPIRHGLTKINQFYTIRNLSAMSHLWEQIHRIEDIKMASAIAFIFTSLYQRVTKLSEFRFWGGSGNSARYNVPFIFNETNVFVTFERKAVNILDHMDTTARQYQGKKVVICNSATNLHYLPDSSIDFIFTDPPFGANINYSEMNFLWESWLGVYTDTKDEAIINKYQGKDVNSYQDLMQKSLSECYRVLRAGHWMLLVFMNSSKSVWDAIITAITDSRFIIERLDLFDKKHGTFKQFVSENTAGCDLVLHCRKPRENEVVETQSRKMNYQESIKNFLLSQDQPVPMINFLHVNRESEPDIRRLYSEWLAYSIPRNHELSDFSTFRDLALQMINNHPNEGENE